MLSLALAHFSHYSPQMKEMQIAHFRTSLCACCPPFPPPLFVVNAVAFSFLFSPSCWPLFHLSLSLPLSFFFAASVSASVSVFASCTLCGRSGCSCSCPLPSLQQPQPQTHNSAQASSCCTHTQTHTHTTKHSAHIDTCSKWGQKSAFFNITGAELWLPTYTQDTLTHSHTHTWTWHRGCVECAFSLSLSFPHPARYVEPSRVAHDAIEC